MRISSKIASRKSILAIAITNAIFGNYALAEEAQAQAEDEVIVVTATKRTESIQEVPIAVTSIGGEELVKMQINDILSLEKVIPGLTVSSYGNSPRAVMRGAGTAGTTDIAVPIYHNGMYLPSNGQALAGYIDIERIEALRGPQGTLFGRNTFGGLINVIEKKPDTEEFDFGAAVSVGDYSLRKVEGFVNVPISDAAAFRITAADEQRDPYVKNINNPAGGLKDSDYSYLRAQLLIEPSEDLSINLATSYWKDTGNGNLNWAYKPLGIPLDNDDYTQINGMDGWLDPRISIYQGDGCADGDRAGGRSQSGGNVCDGDQYSGIVDGPFTIDYDYTPNRELKETAFYFNLDWKVADHNVIVNAATFDYQSINIMDADFSGNPSWIDGNYSVRKSSQFDLTISSMGDGPFQYTVGAYLFNDQHEDNKSAYIFGSIEESWYAYAGATPETPSWAYWTSEGKYGTKSTAIYGQADYSFTDKLSVTAGIRRTEDNRRSIGSNSLGWGNWASHLGPELPEYDYTGKEYSYGDDNNVDYRLGADYKINNDLMIYSSFATAYISGSVDNVTHKLLAPQTNEAYEFGFKSTLLDGNLRLNGSVFNGKHDGLTTTVFEYFQDVAVATQVPGGSINAKGAEFEGYWFASDNLVVDFGVSIDFSEYDKFNVGAGNLVWDGEDPVGVDHPGFFSMDGKDTPYTPDTTVSIGLDYSIDLGEMGTISPYVYFYHNSGYMSNRAPVFFGEQEAYTKIDLSVNWESADGSWTAKLWVNNVTDELITTYTEILSRSRVAQDYAAPRSWGLRVGHNF